VLLAGASLATWGCAEATTKVEPPSRPPNILLVIADDVGVDQISAYGVDDSARTPTVDALAADGVRFTRVWANPVCSSTRATILTGRYGFRTGVGFVARRGEDLRLNEVTLAQLLSRHPRTPYGTAAFGKWHLTSGRVSDGRSDVLAAPVLAGFSFFRGVFKNITDSYTQWRAITVREVAPRQIEVDGELDTTYNTTAVVDDAARWIHDFEAQFPDRPWFVWLAFNAAHAPFHKPPSHLHGRSLDDPDLPCRNPPPFDRPQDVRACYQAMIEAMDTELGRLLERELSPASRARTSVLFVGDNGSVKGASTDTRLLGKLKGTPYEGGVNVPLVISGAGVDAQATAASDALVNTTDLFATILELAGLDVAAHVPAVLPSPTFEPDEDGGPLVLDSTSLLPALRGDTRNTPQTSRSFTYAELFKRGASDPRWPTAKTIRDTDDYKLIRFTDPGPGQGREEFYHLPSDPREERNLLGLDLDADLAARHAALRAHLDAVESTGWRPHGPPLSSEVPTEGSRAGRKGPLP
jgi:arylsulfatase A-like enzyme